MKTRGSHLIPFMNHIRSEIEVLLSFLPFDDIYLDGELYNYNVSQSIIKSILRTSKNPHPHEKLIAYYVFDIIDPYKYDYEHRYSILLQAYQEASKYFFFTSVFIIGLVKVSSDEEIWQKHNEVKTKGQEGLVLRQMHPTESYYKPNKKRSNAVLKVKVFKDKTVKILGVIDDSKGREAGCAKLLVLTPDGKELEVRPSGTFTLRSEWLKNPKLIIGKAATLKYFEEDDKPIFPTIIEIRDYE